MVCLMSSMRISVFLNYWYHSKYGIPSYARNNWYQSILISLQHDLHQSYGKRKAPYVSLKLHT